MAASVSWAIFIPLILINVNGQLLDPRRVGPAAPAGPRAARPEAVPPVHRPTPSDVLQQGSPAPNDVQNVKLVFVGMRHGNRNPKEFLPNTGRWGQEGELQLTNHGKRQAYALGQALRVRYSTLLPEHYFPRDIQATSSSAERAQMTMQTFLNGLYPPMGRSVWHQSVPWQAIPVSIDDPMLHMNNVDNCKTSVAAWAPIDVDRLPGLKTWLIRESAVVDYVARHTSWDRSLNRIADVADNLRNLELQNLPFPEWLERPTLAGFDRRQLYNKIQEFREARQVACAHHAPCRNIMAGVWLNDITNHLTSRRTERNIDLKMAAYSSVCE